MGNEEGVLSLSDVLCKGFPLSELYTRVPISPVISCRRYGTYTTAVAHNIAVQAHKIISNLIIDAEDIE